MIETMENDTFVSVVKYWDLIRVHCSVGDGVPYTAHLEIEFTPADKLIEFQSLAAELRTLETGVEFTVEGLCDEVYRRLVEALGPAHGNLSVTIRAETTNHPRVECRRNS